ncbi:TPA: hypothetical protein PCO36_000362 [Klebsiella oxytoca]|nr:hypothetical protein [Klebsiella oxytoca]
MEEFKGTPGPWFRDNGRAIGPKSAEDDQSYGMVTPVGWVEFDPEIEVQVANQQMMAAAPELLEALQLMLDSQVLPVWHQSIARAAINKALGK